MSDQTDRVTPGSRARFGDYARDVLAVLFLLLPLGMAWDLDQVAVDYGTLIGAAQSVALTVDMATILSLWLVFAGAIVLVLTAPSSVRAEFEPQSARSPAAVAPTSPRAVPAEDESIWETGPNARDSG